MEKPIDLSHVVCGLVPEMVRILKETEENEVVFAIRKNIHHEIVSGFGTGGEWEFTFEQDLFHDLARFKRKSSEALNPLSMLDY